MRDAVDHPNPIKILTDGTFKCSNLSVQITKNKVKK